MQEVVLRPAGPGGGGAGAAGAGSPGSGGETIAVEAVFLEEELAPNSALCAGLVNLDERGFILIDLKSRTSRPGVFAAGDVTNTHIEQVLVAVGEGAKAALSAFDYLLAAG